MAIFEKIDKRFLKREDVRHTLESADIWFNSCTNLYTEYFFADPVDKKQESEIKRHILWFFIGSLDYLAGKYPFSDSDYLNVITAGLLLYRDLIGASEQECLDVIEEWMLKETSDKKVTKDEVHKFFDYGSKECKQRFENNDLHAEHRLFDYLNDIFDDYIEETTEKSPHIDDLIEKKNEISKEPKDKEISYSDYLTLILIFFLAFILIVGAVNLTKNNNKPNISQTTPYLQQTVYVTKTGEKYHKSNCRYLKKSVFKGKSKIKLYKARNKGYTPCKVCKP